MANKKISQLTSMGSVGIGSADHFVVSESLGAGNYATVKTSPLQLANYVLNPISATQISGAGKNVFFNNSSWDTAGLGENFPYLQVDIDHGGKLVTGSGISVPAIGDNMGNCVATTNINTQGFSVSGLGKLGFGNVMSVGGFDRSHIRPDIHGHGTDLEVVGYQDLTLSGNRHVNISGQALSLENGDIQTPISGNVIITGGNLEIDPGNKLIVNEISCNRAGGDVDDASITIEGSSRHVPYNFSSAGAVAVNWPDSNIQYTSSTIAQNVDFTNVADGQTLTFYWENTRTDSTSITPKFRSGVYGTDEAGAVRWGAEFSNTAPAVAPNKTNVYTFVRINTGIFASAVTGYVY
jgi:hypothetical protein